MQIAKVFRIFGTVLVIVCLQLSVLAQQDTSSHKKGIEAFLKRQKGIIGKLAGSVVGDTVHSDLQIAPPLRNDLPYKPYESRAIRNIYIQRLDFGTLITDTGHNFKNSFTRLANTFHRKSREYVIRNNLFFKKGDRVLSYLMADNERQLRDQPYIQDAKIILQPVPGSPDSVDVLVRVKDVLSLGGTFELHNMQSGQLSAREDNLDGWGNTLSVGTLYDQVRRQHSGVSGQYVNRNIAGSFIDGFLSYTNYASSSSSGEREDEVVDARLTKPLVNAYTKWTYSLEASNHVMHNMYWSDSLYQANFKYRYYTYDAWVGWNTGAYKLASGNDDNRLRTLVSLRYFKQLFLSFPDRYLNQYFYQYADITGIIGSIALFKQNFYKTQYFYGFGRNEDVPEGTDMSFTAGWVDKSQKNRPYAGIDLERYFFAPNKSYYNFIFRTGGFWGARKPEDLDVLLSMDHYSRLLDLGSNWKERSLINASITGQFSQVLNSPLYLQSPYGLDEWKNSNTEGADFRATLRAESVFFSPYTFINFHFAPFVFCNLSLINPVRQNIDKSDLYSSIGGGIRTRNESLVFGTFELKVFYYPRKTFTGDTWRIETNTGIRFKYNSQQVRRPDLIVVN